MAKYILLDTETTGNTKEDHIIQIGSMIVGSKTNIEVFDELCSCEVPIKLEAMEVHNITPEYIENKPKFIETSFFKRLNELNSNENFLIAHNLPFDLEMLQKEGFVNKCRLIDTLQCSKHLLPDVSYHRLQYLRYALELYKDEAKEASMHNIHIKAHNAIGDVLVMKLLLSKLVLIAKQKFPNVNPMKKLEELTSQPVFVKVFKFGKHKDKNIEDVCREDMNYINWMMNNMDLDGDMKYTLNKITGRL